MAEIRETAILIDHDHSTVKVDTNVRGMVSRLVRAGFAETTTKESAPYRRFTGTIKQVGLRKARVQVPPMRRSSYFGRKTAT